MGIFCIIGSVATLLTGYVLVVFTDKSIQVASKVFKASMYYITMALLFMDPFYLSILCSFFGGGDMNGISLLVPEILARIVYGIILLINIVVFLKFVLPKYKLAFADEVQ